jgi:hypothetical protein
MGVEFSDEVAQWYGHLPTKLKRWVLYWFGQVRENNELAPPYEEIFAESSANVRALVIWRFNPPVRVLFVRRSNGPLMITVVNGGDRETLKEKIAWAEVYLHLHGNGG